MASKAEYNPAPARRIASDRPRAPSASLAGTSWPAMADDVAAWDALADEASEPNPFFESWYLLPSLRAFDPQGDVGALRFEIDGQLAGLMPLVRPSRYYRYPLPHLASWLHGNSFLGAPLVRRGAERAFWEALLLWADSHAGPGLFLHLRQMPLRGPLYEALQAVLRAQPRKAAVVQSEERAMLASPLDSEAYLEAAMSGKKRKELRRQFARLSECGELGIARTEHADGLDSWLDAFLTLEKSGWKGQAGSALACDPRTAQLFREALHGAAFRGRLERLTLSLDSRPIAMLATFLASPGAFSFKTAFDEDFARFSPGVLLQRENLAMLSNRDIAWTDSCAAADHPMIDHIWRERRRVGSLSIAIGGTLRRAAFGAWLRAETRRNPTGQDA